MPLSNAESTFENAFQRLVQDCPEILPKGSKVTQNNIAREAGVTPSALRKERFPHLIEKIQIYVKSNKVGKDKKKSLGITKATSSSVETRMIKIEHLEADATSRVLSLLAEVSDLRSHILKTRTGGEEGKIYTFKKNKN